MLRIILALLLFHISGFAQTIFPGLQGQELLDSLVANYKTTTVLQYSMARDTLFANIDSHDDSLTGVYSGFTIYLDPTQDPTTYAFNHGINTEHTYPQSKGAVGQAKSDMHHLYPTRINVNAARASFPFAEIPDQNTDFWYRLDQILTTIPQQFIEEYSELDDNGAQSLFEPREDHKGNVARAMFYFYTMYRQEADNADPQFFPLQKNILYQWHKTDQVDAREILRNNLIASYQGGKKNPFIVDTTLIRRAYFPNPQEISNGKEILQNFQLHQNYPNPFNPSTRITYQLSSGSEIELSVYNLLGQKIRVLVKERQPAGSYEIEWDGKNSRGEQVPAGIYFYKLSGLVPGLAGAHYTMTRKMVLIK